jgi:diguanylate cyclase (GGDEF)-like protein
MERKTPGFRERDRPQRWFYYLGGIASLAWLTWWLRSLSVAPDPLLYGLLQIASGVLAFTFVASALVRFRGTRGRSLLVVAIGFALSGIFTMGASVGFFRQAEFEGSVLVKAPLAWWVSGTLLAMVMLLALVADRGFPAVRHPGAEIAFALALVALATYFISLVYQSVPVARMVYPGWIFPRPLSLLTAGIFFLTAIGFARRLRETRSSLDRGLCASMWLNVGCHLAAAQSVQLRDAAFATSQFLMVAANAVALGGVLVDSARVFDRVHELASSDPLTGLGNYRRLLDVLTTEVQRSGRTGRPFALVLLDLDGLKHINDRYGHVVGSQALCRLASILLGNCRSIDTAARYGGDEFALVLPETDERAAKEVVGRICERLGADQLGPKLSVSTGVAICPLGGVKIEQLLAGADEALYAMKARRKGKSSEAPPAATGWLFER